LGSLKVVITDCNLGPIDQEKAVLCRIGIDPILAHASTEAEVIASCQDAHGLIIQYAPLTKRVLEELPNCQVVSRYGVGVDSIDVPAATSLGIIVANVPDYGIEEVCDQTLALFLSWVRRVGLLDGSIRSGTWDFRVGRPIPRLRGMTYGIIGCGRIGRGVATRVRGFGLRVIGFDPYLTEAEGIQLVSLETLLVESDFISIHCPLTESTHHLVGPEQFQMMKRKPLILNVSRGSVIDEKALIEALDKQLVRGAALDVLEQEPPDPGSPLLKKDTVILSPHIGFYSDESIVELKTRVAENVVGVFIGERPRSIVNPEVLGKSRSGL
jgi:D-3-phosphoglycerate dehydrogenase